MNTLFFSSNITFILYLLFTVVISQSIPLVIETNTSRFDKIYLPKQNDTFPAELYHYSTFISPVSRINTYTLTTELCQNDILELQSYDPNLWNNSLIQKPCTEYLCIRNKPYNSTLFHYKVHRYCLQCSATSKENISLSSNCSLIDKTYCNMCTSQAICIYNDINFPFCYRREFEKFYRRDDFTHLVILTIFYYVFPCVALIFSISFLLFFTIFLIIPLLRKIILEMKTPELSIWNKLKSLLSFHYQIIILLYISTIVLIFTSLIDFSLDVVFVDVGIYLNAIGAGLFLNAALKLVATFALIIHWFYVIRIMDSFENGKDPSFFKYYALYLSLIGVFGLFGFSGLIFYVLYRFVDKAQRITWIYFVGVDVLLLIMICTVCILVLLILSILMLIKLSKVEKGNDSFFEFAIQLRVML